MEIHERFFPLDNESCVIHLPTRPNGFGILLLGDYNFFVGNSTSLWMQHVQKVKLLETLRDKGYTIFSSNLYGRHWGSQSAVSLAKRLYHVVMKKEILNEKIHMIAEGMGALVAIQLMHSMPSNIRSVVMLNPCLHLPLHIEIEKEHKFFYKRLLRELQLAYNVEEEEVLQAVSKQTFRHYSSTVPVKLLLPTHERQERKKIAREYELFRRENGSEISLLFHLPESNYNMVDSIGGFFREYERIL